MSRGLKIYNVLSKTASTGELKDVIFVPEGFSFWALVLNGFWLLYHRVWWWAVAYWLVVSGLMELAEAGFISQVQLAIANLVINLLIACEGNNWRLAGYLKRGYKLLDIVAASNEDTAELRFMDKQERASFRRMMQQAVQQNMQAPAPVAEGAAFSTRVIRKPVFGTAPVWPTSKPQGT